MITSEKGCDGWAKSGNNLVTVFGVLSISIYGMLCGLNQSELIGEPILLWLNMFQLIRLWTSSLQSLLLSGLTRFSSSSQEWFIWVETWESALQEALLKQGWTSRRRWSSCVALKPFWNPFALALRLLSAGRHSHFDHDDCCRHRLQGAPKQSAKICTYT